MRWKSERGGALGLVLAVAALALLAAFTAANVATLNLRVSSTVANASIAESLAESAAQQALANLQEDLAAEDSVNIDGKALGLPDGSRGYLTFDEESGLPYSTNNFLGEKPDGWQRTLPESTAHLVGVGECGGVTKHVEIVVHLPEFPVVMGCDGPVTIDNSFIGGFKPEDGREWEAGQGYSVEEDEIGPGHLVTNSDAANSIEFLDSKSKVTGDVQTRGDVVLRGSTVDGEVRARWGKPAPLPEFNLRDFDPAEDEDILYDSLPATSGSLPLVGNVRRDGNLSLTGDMRLQNAFLFVDGNLRVGGDLRGQGAIVATGKIEFEGTAEIEAGEQLAVLSEGGIDLVGRDPTRSVFQGLLYTKGDFIAEKVTIVGGFVVDNGGRTAVIDSNVFFSGVHIAPALRRETYAVIPRFALPKELDENQPRFSELGQPYLRWQYEAGSLVRNADNVWEKGPESAWRASDPALLIVTWVGDEARISYRWRGTGMSEGYLPKDLTYWTDPEVAAEVITATNQGEDPTHTDVKGHLKLREGESLPDRAAYKQYVLDVIGHLKELNHPTGNYNFALDPNEFIGDDEELRILLHRVF